MRGRALGRVAAACACYAAAVVWLTWPLAAHLATHLPRTKFICDFDLRQMIWALSWQTHALVTAPSRLLEANAYHPTPHALLYADAGVGALPYFLPTYVATGNPVLASNLLFLGAVVLTATSLHWLVARWTGRDSAGVVAATVLLTTPWVLWTWVPAAPNYAVLFLVPPIIWLVAEPAPSARRGWLLALLLVLQGAVTPYYAAAVLIPVGLVACVRLVSSRGARPLVGAIAAATLALAALYAPYAWLRLREPNLPQQTPWAAERLAPWITPLEVSPEFFRDPTRPASVPAALLVVVLAGVAVRLLVRRPDRPDGERIAWRQGLLWTGVGLLLSLPPTIRVLDVDVAVPHARLLDRLPMLDLLRDPIRMGLPALFGLAILAGASFVECTAWLERRRALRRPALLRALAAVGIAFLGAGAWWAPPELGFSRWPEPYPLRAAAIPASSIAAALRGPAGGAVVQLPVDRPYPGNLDAHATAMFESIGTWRPLLNGYGGFYPAAFVDRMRVAARLPERGALDELRRSSDLAFVVVRGASMEADARARWETLARDGGDGLTLVARDGTDLLFAVSDAPGTVAASTAPDVRR